MKTLSTIRAPRPARHLVRALAAGWVTVTVALAQQPSPTRSSPHGKLRDTCETCHISSSWRPAVILPAFDHGRSGFPLVGAHKELDCLSCHASLVFSDGRTSCGACHVDPHKEALGSDCSACHTARSFQDRSEMTRAHQRSRFPLTGAHSMAECESCHPSTSLGSPQFVGISTDCAACHMQSYESAKEPDHARLDFPKECANCHTTVSWDEVTFRHNLTAFPLTGAHVETACSGCHGAQDFRSASTDCGTCHASDFTQAKNPDHVAGGFFTDCLLCHTTARWVDARFNHDETAFRLTGAHGDALCSSCHVNGRLAGTPKDCVGCHQQDFDGATSPDHRAARWDTDCQSCHETDRWEGASFDHSQTGFPLNGAHATATCNSCHANGQYDGTPTECIACHQEDYDGTTDPDHRAAGFPTTCTTCHNTTRWEGASFDHSQTGFPLNGAHATASCNSCHANGQYDGTPTECIACHQEDFDGTTDPDHRAAGFPTTCTTCHNTTRWEGASFDHSQTGFPLNGAHATATCNSCHANGQYDGTPTECIACHQEDYDGTTDPNHRAAGFPTTCTTCHNTTRWEGATFNHDSNYFPIYSGEHRDKWDSCSDCHTNPNSYTVFSCIICHEHSNQQEVTRDHDEVNGFHYDGQSCYTCHPDGRE